MGARLWYWPEVEAWAWATGRMDPSGVLDRGGEASTRKEGKLRSKRSTDGKHWIPHEMAAARYGVAVEDLRGQPAP